jgi:hypothetical protein
MRTVLIWRTLGVVGLGAMLAVPAVTSCRSFSGGQPAAPASMPAAVSPTPSPDASAADRERAFADLVDRVTNVAFAPDKPAYDVRNVDAFLDEVTASLNAGRAVPAARIQAAAAGFKPAAGVKGYSCEEVDNFMRELTERMAQLP